MVLNNTGMLFYLNKINNYILKSMNYLFNQNVKKQKKN